MVAARNVLLFFLAVILGAGFTILLAGCEEPDDAQKILVRMAARRVGYHLALSDINSANEMKDLAIKVKAGEADALDLLEIFVDISDPLLVLEVQDLLALMGVSTDLGELTPEQLAYVEPMLDGFIEGVTLAGLIR